MTTLTVVPAYGRDYKSRAEALAAWDDEKDFLISDMSAGPDNGRYVNKPQVPDGMTVNIRYKRQTMVAVVRPGRKQNA